MCQPWLPGDGELHKQHEIVGLMLQSQNAHSFGRTTKLLSNAGRHMHAAQGPSEWQMPLCRVNGDCIHDSASTFSQADVSWCSQADTFLGEDRYWQAYLSSDCLWHLILSMGQHSRAKRGNALFHSSLISIISTCAYNLMC